ncbi:MAG: superoxide dismutase [Ni] [Candidatus Omnitrophota bacterium]
MKKILPIFCMMLFFSAQAFPHCQIPCGIYNDDMRLDMMEEDILTIEKSMNQIDHLSSEEKKDYNQIVRWVENKDDHADKISDTATYYFMAQRVTPVDMKDKRGYELYARKLALLHQLVFYSMKAKQTTDISYVDKMRVVLKEFRAAYSQ